MGFSGEQFCKWIALWRGLRLFLLCFCNVLFPYHKVQDFISHITEPLVELNSLTKARMRTHTPALGSVWLFYLPVNPLFLESPQAVQTWPFNSCEPSPLSPPPLAL